jgi:ATP-dependent exoDNAse (exonuclease V) beta subunit
MTVHQSKGLGFDLVIVPFGARDRSFGAPAAPALLAGEDWVLEPPLASVREAAGGPPEEAWQAAQARANFEQLCVLYVAMTRAAHALYMLVPAPPKSPSASRPADLLRERLGGDAAPPAAESGTRLLYEHGDRDWRLHARRAAADEAPRAAPAPTPVAWVAEPRRVEPSKESWSRTALRAAWLFEQEASDVRAFGSALHRLFQAVTWSDDLDIESVIAHWRAGSGEPEAVLRDAEIQFRACLAVPEIARCLARPAAGAEVWNEAAFDVVFDTGGERRILSGRFDRLVVERAADGRPARATVVDFKSDRVETGAQVAARAGEHEPQMRDYMRAAARLLGLPAESVQGRLVFTRPARIADVAPPACGGASA